MFVLELSMIDKNDVSHREAKAEGQRKTRSSLVLSHRGQVPYSRGVVLVHSGTFLLHECDGRHDFLDHTCSLLSRITE